jgi:nucleoside-diphosphate-sugar epimerase
VRVFVAGASGAIGRRLVPLLAGAGHEVTGMTRSSGKAEALRELGAEPVVCDAFDRDRLRAAVEAARPDVVVHELTDLPDALDPRKLRDQLASTDRLRSEGTRNLVDAAVAAAAPRVVAQSIAFAYRFDGEGLKTERDPLNLDAPPEFRRSVEALRDLERAVTETEGIEGIVLRYGYFYGPGTSYAPDGSTAAAVRGRRFPVVGRGQGVFSFIHVDDAAQATLHAVDRGAPGIYNVVDDDPAPVREWLPAFAEAVGAPPPRRVPRLLARIGAGRYATELSTRQRGASNARAKAGLGWEPRIPSWRQGFRESLG